ncbi:hypothetical protein A5881_001868 [Enterococcus termitis]
MNTKDMIKQNNELRKQLTPENKNTMKKFLSIYVSI